ncbi:MAG TPA: cytochrome C [Xanthobacteraceae bacterium]
MRSFIAIVLLLSVPALAAAAGRPDWAFPSKSAETVTTPPDEGKPKQVAGSAKSFVQSQIDDPMNPPDWFPDEHPPLPQVVAHGGSKGVRACMGCHMPTGLGHPENSRLPGSTAAYLMRQLADFRSGARSVEGGGGTMLTIAKSLTDEEMTSATSYFAGLKPLRWTRVVETDTVPRSYFKGTARLPHPAGGTEPIGNRIIELPEDFARFEMRDPHSGFVSYVPTGTLAKGEALVATGGGGTTLPCAICHGPELKGIGDVPGIAGRSPGNIARELYYFQIGTRGGASAALMKGVTEKLSADDILAISAYVASREP